ncbi:methyl-accepting chemotaxis protein [Vibrio sonorensis]|uniref:methyl-accepting chemotaxis protein n=1 Tax=Vibrio sonorensis TaxID=1004316 RepID=UPI0008DA81D6|nr:methyl-accepting chemotaxis protein [Vibrio sonorensis]
MERFSLRRINIRQRLFLLTLIVTTLLLIPTGSLLLNYQSDLMEAKQVKTRHLVETAYSVIEHYHQLEQDGALSTEQAKQQAQLAVSKLRYEEADYFWINDSQPAMIMHPFKPQLNGKDLSGVTDPQGKALFVEMVKVVKAQGEGIVDYMWPKPGSEVDVAKISFVKEFTPWGWIVGSGVYVDDVNALIWERVQSSLILVSLALVLMLIVAGIIGKSITQPCSETQKAMEEIARGDGDLTRQLPVNGNDELAHIAQAFNEFTAKIRHIVVDLSPITRKVTNSAVELNQVAHQSSQKALDQKSSVENLSSAMEQLHASNVAVSNSAQEAAEAAKLANQNTQSSSQVIHKASRKMEDLSETVSRTEDNVQKLADETEKVSAVLEVIRGVAEQTNLLALNAAIEAARAGEQGRGFAVVADEVRTLATRTSSSTDEIAQIIDSLQERAKHVCRSMEETQTQSQETLKHASEAERTLAEVDNQIATIVELNSHIATSSEEQTSATDDMSHELVSLSDHSDQAAAQANQVASASEQLKEGGEQLESNFAMFKV